MNYRAELTGLFGDPVDDNPTGVMEEAAYNNMSLNYRYITMKVSPENLKIAMRALPVLGFKGINLTMPHKIMAMEYVDEMSEAARIIGAINSVLVKEDGQLFGENTDGKGFILALKEAGESVTDKQVVILGAGGAARAIAIECALNNAKKIWIINRNIERAKELAEILNKEINILAEAIAWQSNMDIPSNADFLINATPVGMLPYNQEKPSINYDTVHSDMVVADVVFNPVHTLFLLEAQKRGAKIIDGLGMLAQQGALNFTLWTGYPAPTKLMVDVLKKQFNIYEEE